MVNNESAKIFSAPGRTEICGNHTDHQHGKVLAAAINLDTRAVVRPNADNVIRINSEGFTYPDIDLNQLQPVKEEEGTTAALVRGVAARIAQLGHPVCGFDADVSSTVLPGSGLSSSAAFEVLIGTILNELGHCGLMDQTASPVGNMITIDFKDPSAPVVKPLEVDFSSFRHSLCIIDSGADHADLTGEYASIPRELKTLCRCYGKEYLRDLPEDEFWAGLAAARKTAGDRAVLRAIHVYEDNKRVDGEIAALEAGNFDEFLSLIKESGRSSWMLLQNITPTGSTVHQDLAVALSVCEKLLGGRGACRVHGGGFAGTIQAFVPDDMLQKFRTGIEQYLGTGSCHVLNIRREGGVREE